MNERLKELLKQSGAYDYYEVNEGVEGDEKPMEKFAELIVKECLNNMENCEGDLDFAIWKTKQDFGVKS